MRRMKKWIALSFVVAAVTSMTTIVHAGAITILNASFETPAVSGASASGAPDYWNTNIPVKSGIVNNLVYTHMVDGVTGNQYAYLYGNPTINPGNLWQGGPIEGVTSGTLIEAGESYTLSADIVGMAAFAGSSSGTTMEMRIYYTTDLETLTTLASTEIAFDDVYDAELTNQVMTTYTCTTPVISDGSPAEGAYIGVWFGLTSVSGATDMGVDNVQLSSTASEVPEPSTAIGLVCLLLGGLFLRKRAHR